MELEKVKANDLRILSLYKKIDKNIKLSKQLKMLAAVCLFFSICYCQGSNNIENKDIGQIILTNLVWIISIIVLIGIYVKDSSYIKKNKTYELDIYRLEVEELNSKKKIAEMREDIWIDDILNKEIDKPSEEISLPIVYYGILLLIDIITRILI